MAHSTLEPKLAPYGTWESPISNDLLASADNSLVDCFARDTDEGKAFYYLEGRPAEAGRQVIVRDHGGNKEDVLPQEFSAQSKIHEYGGASFTLTADGRLIFVDGKTQGVYYLDPKSKATQLIYEAEGSRFADFDQTSIEGKTWIIAVHEKPKDQYNELTLLDPEQRSIVATIKGADFYTKPQFSPDGRRVCWLQWNLEDMPWTGAQLYVAEFQNGQFINYQRAAGQATKRSISQPTWHPDGDLFFVSDRTGYYKLYRFHIESLEGHLVGDGGLQDYDRVEFSSPDWQLGARTYVHLSSNHIVAAFIYQAGSGLAVLDLSKNTWTELPTAYVDISRLSRVSDTRFIVIGSGSSHPKEIVELDIQDSSYRKVIAESTSLDLPKSIFSKGQSIVFPRSDGSTSYAWLWQPQNPSFKGPAGARPPLIIHCHGGPTAHVGPGLDLQKQYFTSRGFSYASVNYGGSSGYGRAYRDDLNGNWGDLDASDAAAFARFMCSDQCPAELRTSAEQVGITGGSAGGYTVLRALTLNDFPWKAGISLYGIGNITLLEQDTHKFESRYTRILFDPPGKDLSKEEREKLYHDKSPQFFASQITAATLLLQGREDKVVPLNQAEEMKREIEKAGQIAKLVVYDGEGHGFRKAESIKDMLDQMEQWWRKYLVKE